MGEERGKKLGAVPRGHLQFEKADITLGSLSVQSPLTDPRYGHCPAIVAQVQRHYRFVI